MKLPVAAQVYSVREQAEADFGGTMQQLADMGYDGVELAGLYGKSAGEIRACSARLTRLSLTPTIYPWVWKMGASSLGGWGGVS